MNILLSGYFDKNFGDDVMHRTVVGAFPDHTFYVNCPEREMLSHLEDFANVHINEPCKPHLFLSVTGTGFMYKGKRAKAEKLITMLTSKKQTYPKSALINCSLEEFDSQLAKYFANCDLRQFGLITCRDKTSFEYLSKAFPRTDVRCFPDIVFSEKPKTANRDMGYLGVAPVRRVYTGDNYDYYKQFAAFCDRYVDENNKDVRIFAFDNGIENDVSAAESVRLMMKNKSRAGVVIYGGDCDSFANALGECSYFAGSRFHSIVMARLLGIPCFAVYDREKLRRLCRDEDIPGIEKSEFTADGLYKFASHTKVYNEAQGHIDALREFISRR